MSALLTQFIEEFKKSHHGESPEAVYVTPAAAIALSIKKSLGPIWQGVPIVFKPEDEIENEVVKPGEGRSMLLFVKRQNGEMAIRVADVVSRE